MSKVMKVEFDGEEDVYNITVDEYHTVAYVTSKETVDISKNLAYTSKVTGLISSNCGEQPLPPHGACLLGSINLTKFVKKPFTEDASFDWETFREVIHVFTRMLDNVVEFDDLPLEEQRGEIARKRRHGMGFLGLGSALNMLGMRYGHQASLVFTERAAREIAEVGWTTGVSLAREKGPAPIMQETFEVTTEMLYKRPEMATDGYKKGDLITGKVLISRYSRYMQQLGKEFPSLVALIEEHGSRFTHHSSIAPTGTISLSMAGNASNGIEPSFAHRYSRNIIREGKNTKEKVEVVSYELLAYQEAHPGDNTIPESFVSTDDVQPREHVKVQAAAQKWVDSSISKTINVPSDFEYHAFKDIYLYAHEMGLKGATTFRFNPEAFQGVLVKEEDLENTLYKFTLEDGSTVELKGSEEVEYDGETHSVANLYDALKEGFYGTL